MRARDQPVTVAERFQHAAHAEPIDRAVRVVLLPGAPRHVGIERQRHEDVLRAAGGQDGAEPLLCRHAAIFPASSISLRPLGPSSDLAAAHCPERGHATADSATVAPVSLPATHRCATRRSRTRPPGTIPFSYVKRLRRLVC